MSVSLRTSSNFGHFWVSPKCPEKFDRSWILDFGISGFLGWPADQGPLELRFWDLRDPGRGSPSRPPRIPKSDPNPRSGAEIWRAQLRQAQPSSAQLRPAQLSPTQLSSTQLSSAQPNSAQLSPTLPSSAWLSAAQLISQKT